MLKNMGAKGGAELTLREGKLPDVSWNEVAAPAREGIDVSSNVAWSMGFHTKQTTRDRRAIGASDYQ